MADCLKEDGVELLFEELTAATHRGGFQLSEWITSSCRVLSSILKEDRAKEVKALNLDSDQLPTEKALGVQWCVEDDAFTFNVAIKPHSHSYGDIAYGQLHL